MFLTKELAVIVVNESVELGTLYTFPVELPSRENYFYVQGMVKACAPVKENFEDETLYKLHIEQLAGATEQDDSIFNVYLTFKQTEQQLELIRKQNEEITQRIQIAIKSLERAALILEKPPTATIH